MNITCIQMDMELGRPDENFSLAARLIREAAAAGPDVIVLPETWNTGFFPREDLETYCDRDARRVKREIGALAAELGVNIAAGSVANLRNGKVYNTACIFDRTGQCIAEYDKTHLFTPMQEHVFFEKGGRLCLFELDGMRCGILICYDIRFPELTRTLALGGMDVLFVVSQWPLVRIPHLKTLAKARAIENQMFVAVCNSCGRADGTVYGGGSVIYDPWGTVLAEAGEGPGIISAACDGSILGQIRTSINVFNDRRAELYKI
ncbi:MAG: carbon-nitrogen family hydrolase [Lachnospiraceae bacterium]|nr:carbon-nitrogen family hydrolase [Lachnospiraceae bacterium]